MIHRFLQWALPTAVVLAALLFLAVFVAVASTPRPSPAAIPAAVTAGPDAVAGPASETSAASGNLPARTGAPTIDGDPLPTTVLGPAARHRHPAATTTPPQPSPRPIPSGPSATPVYGRKEAPSKTTVRAASAPPASNSSASGAGATLRGAATWYDVGSGYYGAMPGYVDGTVVQAVVTSFHDGRTWSVTVVVVTQCGCPGGRVIDLSPAAFLALGWPLSRGIAPVTVQLLEGTLP